jgi:hypothetical protein
MKLFEFIEWLKTIPLDAEVEILTAEAKYRGMDSYHDIIRETFNPERDSDYNSYTNVLFLGNDDRS